jgi:hypothetical protein
MKRVKRSANGNVGEFTSKKSSPSGVDVGKRDNQKGLMMYNALNDTKGDPGLSSSLFKKESCGFYFNGELHAFPLVAV